MVGSRAVALPGGDETSHPSHRLFSLLPHGKRYQISKSGGDATLNGAAVEPFEDLRTHAKSF